MMRQETVGVLWNTHECSGYYRMGLGGPLACVEAEPGQFVMVRLPEGTGPLLRRPFSIHRLIRSAGRVEGIELLYKVVGAGTRLLSRMERGDRLDVVGPLGRGFTVPEGMERAFLVAGGIGVAPMFFLGSTLQLRGVPPSACSVFIGGGSRDDLLCVNDFFTAGMQTLQLATEDGSAGERDRVTGPLARAVAARRPDRIYACGPLPMLTAVAEIARAADVPCEVSVESMMACGMGACLGCAVRDRNRPDRYLHACKDGPVFDARVIDLEGGGI
jgi:dihydroorotate dehydrogenase electron transfer subunit